MAKTLLIVLVVAAVAAFMVMSTDGKPSRQRGRVVNNENCTRRNAPQDPVVDNSTMTCNCTRTRFFKLRVEKRMTCWNKNSTTPTTTTSTAAPAESTTTVAPEDTTTTSAASETTTEAETTTAEAPQEDAFFDELFV